MATFIMLGKYSSQGLKNASAVRTRKAEHLVSKMRGKIINIYALMGEYDLLLLIDLPGTSEAITLSAGLTKLTGVSFVTSPAMPITEFDKVITQI
jgi:uncharacterized protein with GYD domain